MGITSVIIVVAITFFILLFVSMVILLRTRKKSRLSSMQSSQVQDEDQYRQKCFQNQYIDDPKNKYIKVHTIPSVTQGSMQSLKIMSDAVSEHVANHTYESIDESSVYENNLTKAVIFTPQREQAKVKNNKKFVDDSGYLFYNVTTIDPAIHKSVNLVLSNPGRLSYKPSRNEFHSFRRP